MTRIQVKVGTRYLFQKQIYNVKQLLADNCYRIENLHTGEESVISYSDILTTWSNGELRFEVTGSNAVPDTEAPLKTRFKDDDLADLPETVREEAWRRYHLVLAVYRYYQLEPTQMLSRREIETFVSNTGQTSEPKASRGSLERYMQSFVNSGGDIRSLVPHVRQQGGKDQSRLDEDIERILKTILEKYASITKRESTVDQIVADVLTAIADENRFRAPQEALVPPSERTIRRRIKEAGEKRILGRTLSRREQKVQTETEPGLRPARILERVEIDHTTLDLFVVDERDGLPIGRPHITACIDKYSALAPGWHIGFNQGGYESIMLCLQHAFLPKPDYRVLYGTEHDYPVHGLFEKLCIDNGPDYKSADLRNALAELGIIREEMPSQTPWFKGTIERYFRSVNQRLLKGKPGYTFGNVVALGDYDAQKDAAISLSAFLEIFHIFMVDVYPYSWHEGLEAIPMQRWQESARLFMPDLFEDAAALKRVLLPSAERVLQAKGIEWESNFYRGAALARLRELYGKEKVRFKYNPDEMDVIYVRDSSHPTGWAEFHSTNPDYTQGLSLAKHRVIRQYLGNQKQTVDRFSLARAKTHIQQVIEREFLTTQKLRRRSRLKPLLQPETSSEKKEASRLVGKRRPAVSTTSQDDSLPDMTGWSSDYGLPITRDDQL